MVSCFSSIDCNYERGGSKNCLHPRLANTAYCALHHGCDRKPQEPPPDNPNFRPAFEPLLAAKDGDWQGFVFPTGIDLPREIDFPVNAADAALSGLTLDQVVFKETVDFAGATFFGATTLRGVQFEKRAVFERCRFTEAADFLNVKFDAASFYRAEFAGRAIFRANFAGNCTFNEAIFKEAVVFAGWQNVSAELRGLALAVDVGSATLPTGANASFWQRSLYRLRTIAESLRRQMTSIGRALVRARERLNSWIGKQRRRVARTDPSRKSFRVFESTADMSGVVFLRPAQTSFRHADLATVIFLGTNLRGINFVGVSWWQPSLKRNGLRDEIFFGRSDEGPFRHSYLPALEEACRNARVALEENRSFGMASDFYIGEMEAMRAQRPFIQRHLLGVPALYRFVSNYGTSVGTALKVLFYFAVLYLGSSVLANRSADSSLAEIIDLLGVRSYHTMRLLAFQTPVGVDEAQGWLDVLFRILFAIQTAMVILAFRSRIKRQ